MLTYGLGGKYDAHMDPMDPAELTRLTAETLYLVLLVSGPPLLVALGIGLFVGLLLGIFAADGGGWIGSVLTGLLIGLVFGAVFGAVGYSTSRGQRDFTSTSKVVASRYDVMCAPQHAEQARAELAKLSLRG